MKTYTVTLTEDQRQVTLAVLSTAISLATKNASISKKGSMERLGALRLSLAQVLNANPLEDVAPREADCNETGVTLTLPDVWLIVHLIDTVLEMFPTPSAIAHKFDWRDFVHLAYLRNTLHLECDVW